MEVLPCSRVAHIERTRKPYNNDIDYYAKRNALRAAEVWMDGFKSHVYMAWNIPMTVSRRLGNGRPLPSGTAALGLLGQRSPSSWGSPLTAEAWVRPGSPVTLTHPFPPRRTQGWTSGTYPSGWPCARG